MRPVLLAAASALAMLSATAGIALASEGATAASGGKLSGTDKKFLNETATGAEYELALAKVAQDRATGGSIRDYAQTVATDHEQLNSQLHDLAQQKGIELPTAMTDRQQKKLERLKRMQGAAFDRAYVREETRINQADKSDLRRELHSTKDADVRSFVQKMQAADSKHTAIGKSLEKSAS